MLKKFFPLAVLAALLSPVYAAGTVPGYGPSQQLDDLGHVLANCFLYTIQAGTTSTPQNAYQDSGLTIALPNPQRCSASGRLPQFFLADGSIKIRLTDRNGVNVITNDGILVVGASSGGGGGSPVDPTTVLQTGWMQPIYGTGTVTGFVRANGKTIGSAISGATERANADTQALYIFLYGQDVNLAVSGGRGASAAADFAANKTLTLPDWRGRALAFMDDMGNAAAGRLTATNFGTAATVLGAAGGLETQTLTLAQLPTGIKSNNLPAPDSGLISATSALLNLTAAPGAQLFEGASQNSLSINTTLTGNVTSNNTGGTSHPIVQPTMLATIYIKL